MESQNSQVGIAHEFTLKFTHDNGMVLYKDNHMVHCHLTMPIPMSGALGGTNFYRFPCCTRCGKANIIHSDDKDIYVQSCDGTINEFILKVENDSQENTPTLTLI